ncbi:cortical protein marker for cell polarity-domain-containing protein [Rhodofomes roseus]|uniref:Cortical protein marker for cell polarity-domain-containing protein n=1 Tax=Rhodofomes roseus TaxID=34475 RepID=A0ABQ8K344_9APHY|nr:cortical protein marker for cell polarity-domain-containing protein [Rhodofomes roseus]KAH9831218.1 cortical protein marker for cell polarity-domain-containing protein [Rhodofomes roseus]
MRPPTSLVSSALCILCAHVVSASLPLVDFDRMGTVALTGAFAGLGISDNSTVATSFDSSTATLLSRASDGALTALGSTDKGGSILAGCALNDVFYFGGNFSSINGTSASYIASYSASSDSFSTLGSGGPNGPVHALYCDASNNNVWAGGKFTSPASSVAVWETKSSQWSSPPFGGLSGASAEVLAITTNSSASSLLFAGSFTVSYGNATVNSTNNPSVPYSPGASSFSSSLVPIGLQTAQIVAQPASSESGFNDIEDILCPAGADGAGNTWLAGDGQTAVITARAFSLLSARGIRLGNTFVDGRGTTGFTLTTIPDNTVQTMTYLDPTTGQNQTCSNPCPLLTNSSILYQDFLFSDSLDITGFQLQLTEWQGAGAGLHIMQLLSSGAYASAVASNNTQSCYAPGSSNVTFTGSWTEKQATTNIPGTVQTVLVSDVAVGTSASSGPSVTWLPYVSASGTYDAYMIVPGCSNFQDCGLRTSVSVTVFPGSGLQPWVTTIAQTNTDDQSTLIYSGPVVPSSPNFEMTIEMTLADSPTGSGENGQYELVAGNVELVLTSANITANATGSGNGTSSASANSFGFFEWPLSSSSASSTVSAQVAVPTSAETSLDRVGVDLLSALGGAGSLTSNAPAVSAVVQHSSGALFIGGSFTLSSGSASGASNIVAYKNGALAALSKDGLNGPVTSLTVDGDNLFVGGDFTDTSSASNGALAGVASYSIGSDSWSSLSSGLNGAVASLDYVSGRLLVAGNFSELRTSSASESVEQVSGFAAWDTANSTWVNTGGYLIGSMTFVGNGTSSTDGEFVAGNVQASLQIGATGFVMVQNGADGEPELSPLGVQLTGNSTSATSTSSSLSKRRYAHVHRSKWLPRVDVFKRMFEKRATATTLAPLPPAPASSAPAVFAGAFWTNSSSNEKVIVIGGNFSFTSGGSTYENVAIYDNSSDTITPLQGNQINGTIRTLLVQGDKLFIGGDFTLEGTNAMGFAIYDLAEQSWDMSGVAALSPSSGSDVIVRSITASPSQTDVIIVAGTFAQAGSTVCRAICSYNYASEQWSALGNGIQGEVASVGYTESKQDIIVVAGSLALADSTAANVALYSVSNSTWTALGEASSLPGPVTAVAVNDYNTSSIFAAGRASDNTSSFLYFWDGQSWSSVGSSLDAATDVTQLVMVPLQNTHTSNAVIQSDRVLMMSGALTDSSFGNASAALFDGQSFTPYIVTASASGSAGVLYGLIHSFSTFSFAQKHFLATGIVILISIAIAAGIVFLLALIGILWTLFSRRDDKIKLDSGPVDEDDDSSHRPSSLLEHINAATRATVLGEGAFGPSAEKQAAAGATAGESDPFQPDADNYMRAETPSDAIAGTMGVEDMTRSAHARYSFDGGGEGELPLSAGQEIEVLDDGDAAWWYARDVRSGREGVVPAAYVY